MDTKLIIGEIDAEITRLETARAILARAVAASAPPIPASKPSKRRRLSKVAREKIAAAQRKRWAATKKAVKTTAAKPGKKAAAPAGKRRLSAAARKRIAEAQKKRWAAVKAAEAAKQDEKAVPATKVAKKALAKRAAKKAPFKKVVAAKKAPAKKTPAVKAKKAVPEKAAPVSVEVATS